MSPQASEPGRAPVLRRLGAVLALALVGPMAAPVQAQQNWADVAVPSYTAVDVLGGLVRHGMQPAAEAFVSRSTTLGAALATYCAAPEAGRPAALESARSAWRDTMLVWERLSMVSIGPLVERRATLRLDFTPPRPALIQKAIKSNPSGAADFERVGAPAKGVPALEWLLWTQPAESGTPACSFAVEVARDLGREAVALQQGFATLGEQLVAEEPDEALVRSSFEQFVNQWLGGLERLRWARIDKPRKAVQGGAEPSWPRGASGSTAASWAADWQALRALAVLDADAAPVPGSAPVPIETLLRGRGLNPLADRWREAVQAADAAMAGLGPGDEARLDAAVKALGGVQERLEAEVASALDVGIGFSDADGD